MTKITQKELDEILDKHEKWLRKQDGGERAKLRSVDLSSLQFKNRDMQGCCFVECDMSACNIEKCNMIECCISMCDMQECCFVECNMFGCYIGRCNMSGCIMYGCNMSVSVIRQCNMSGCIMCGCCIGMCDICGCNTRGRDVGVRVPDDAIINQLLSIACPSDGAFIGWKKFRDDLIAELQMQYRKMQYDRMLR